MEQGSRLAVSFDVGFGGEEKASMAILLYLQP